MRYLDPKADLTFKKIFGEHKDLLISLINALLPLNDDEMVESVEYLPPELVPELPTGKNSIVDVRCKDVKGRQFIVEMQMIWTPAFQQRVLFNASKAFVRQLRRNRKYELLQPVYSLNLVNESFMNDYPDEYIHNYNMVHELHSDKGDLSENSEYDAAKEAQAMLEMKISNLKSAIATAKIIDASKLRSDIVQILSTVEMKNVKNGMKMKYTIVSESEANLREGKISSTTPIAQGLLGKKVGDVVEVKIPQGIIQLEILSISVG